MIKNMNYIYLVLFSVLLFVIFSWIDYLILNDYIKECFQNKINNLEPVNTSTKGQTELSAKVSMPLNTTYSCDNKCGPTARCSITGQQCTADQDCPGCNPYSPPLSKTNNCVPGDNDAGKLTMGVTPNYSTLTSDIGSAAALYVHDKHKLDKPVQANFGVNTWKTSFDQQRGQFNNKYKCNDYPYLMKYPSRYSATGEFSEEGPLASNDDLHYVE